MNPFDTFCQSLKRKRTEKLIAEGGKRGTDFKPGDIIVDGWFSLHGDSCYGVFIEYTVGQDDMLAARMKKPGQTCTSTTAITKNHKLSKVDPVDLLVQLAHFCGYAACAFSRPRDPNGCVRLRQELEKMESCVAPFSAQELFLIEEAWLKGFDNWGFKS